MFPDLRGATGSTIIADFNIPLSIMNRSPRQKINIETIDLNYTLDQIT